MADSERLVIDHVGHHGDGVAITGGGNIYVPYTLGGETVDVDTVPGHHPDRRRLLKVEAASAERIAPFCPHFGVCGGCAIQHWDAAAYSAWKRDLVVATLVLSWSIAYLMSLDQSHPLKEVKTAAAAPASSPAAS